MTPTTPLQASFTAKPSPSTTPSNPHKNFDHTHMAEFDCIPLYRPQLRPLGKLEIVQEKCDKIRNLSSKTTYRSFLKILDDAWGSNYENCIRMRQIHSSEKDVASDLLLEREATYMWSLGLPKWAPKWQV